MREFTVLVVAFGISMGVACSAPTEAQDAETASPLGGAIDIHVHAEPDSIARSIDAVEAARQAKASGMRGIVLKNHYESTAGLAYIVGREVPGIEVFGGVDLNLTVGGINPAAVTYMATTTGARGRMVWMPTFDSENQVRLSACHRTARSCQPSRR
jgi:hypothetical protein